MSISTLIKNFNYFLTSTLVYWCIVKISILQLKL